MTISRIRVRADRSLSLAKVRLCYFCSRPAQDAPNRRLFDRITARVCDSCAAARGNPRIIPPRKGMA